MARGNQLIRVLAAVFALTMTACGGASSSSSGNANFTLKVGMVLPFTGDLATYGPSLDKSARMAVKMVNDALKKDGINVTVQVAGSEDDQTTPAAGVEAATKLVKTDGAQVVVGSMSSGVTLAVAQSVAIPNNVLLVTPTSSDPALTTLKGKNQLVWRIYPSDLLQGAALAQAMGDTFGKSATINVGARNDAFGTALAQEFERVWKAAGGKIGQEVIYNTNQASFDADAQKLASGNPTAWMIADFPPTFAKMGPALVRTGQWAPAKTFMTEAMDNNDSLNQIGAPATDGLRGTAGSAPAGPSADAFESAFKAANPGAKFTSFEGTSFDAVVLASLAAVKAGSADPSKIKLQMRAVSGPSGDKFGWQQLPDAFKAAQQGKSISYQGAWGQIAFDQNGDPTAATYVLWQHQAGQTTNLKTFPFGQPR
ncbi:MAG: ABC transporter substrate-binding protein [Candidatus Dormibacter sp.]|uniref:ABC transporter substrate-binding protein n=1 Tax=Candidatus Dormibacter sp. TaxID=2973982 RepID=UPI00268671A7